MAREFGKKLLPEITWMNIAPPYPAYKYFENCENYPFRHDSDSFDMVNAWWLIEAATLAYADAPFAVEAFTKAGLKDVEFISGGQSTECFIAGNDKFAILAFRGSEIRFREDDASFEYIWGDWRTNFTVNLIPWSGGGSVHQGFNDALETVWDQLSPRLTQLLRENKTIWITGHSLGAALATLAAARFEAVRGLYTFGSPRVGDDEFRSLFPVKTYRFVNNNDIVCKIPPKGLYRHVGELRNINQDGEILDRVERRGGWLEDAGNELTSIFNSSRRLEFDMNSLIPDGIRDHVPTLYATHIWNNIPE